MKNLLFALLVCFAINVQAKEIVVSAFGEGEDYDWAVLNAVENAVRQTSDITVERDGLHKTGSTAVTTKEHVQKGHSDFSADTGLNVKGEYAKTAGSLVADGKYNEQAGYNNTDTLKLTNSVKDDSKHILAQYKGVVSSYEVVEQTKNNGLYQVKIKAVIKKEDTYDPHDYKKKSLVKKADYSLAIMPFKAIKNFNCLGRKIDLDEINSLITNAFVTNLMPSRKFNLVDRNNLDNYNDELALINDDMTLPENKVRLKNIVSADYILVGSIDHFSAATTSGTVEMLGEKYTESSSKIKLSYRILETATMEIVSAGTVEKKFSKDGAFSSCANVEELLINRAVKEAGEKLLKDIFSE